MRSSRIINPRNPPQSVSHVTLLPVTHPFKVRWCVYKGICTRPILLTSPPGHLPLSLSPFPVPPATAPIVFPIPHPYSSVMRSLALPLFLLVTLFAIAMADDDWERSDYVKNRRSSPPPKSNAIPAEDHRQARSISAVKVVSIQNKYSAIPLLTPELTFVRVNRQPCPTRTTTSNHPVF